MILLKLTLLLLSCNILDHDHTLFIFSIIRHGARTPNILDSNTMDIFGFKWNQYQGELTRIGMIQQFILGIKFQKYKILIRNDKTKYLYADVSYKNRTQQSFNSFINGFYEEDTFHYSQFETIPNHLPLSKDVISLFDNYNFINKTHLVSHSIISNNDYYLYSNILCKGIKKERNNRLIDSNLNNIWNKYKDILSQTIINPKKSLRKASLDYTSAIIAGYYNHFNHTFISKNTYIDYLNDLIIFRAKDFIYRYLNNNSLKSKVCLRLILIKLLKLLEFRNNYNNHEYSNDNPFFWFIFGHETQISQAIAFILSSFIDDSSDKYSKYHLEKLEYISYCSYINFEFKYSNSKGYYINIIFNDEDILIIDYSSFIKKLRTFIISESEYLHICN